MRVVVDRTRCQGHGLCALFAPELFSLDDGGYSVVGEMTVPAGFVDVARRVADNCPERAILLTEETSP
jgi:ferredoxin